MSEVLHPWMALYAYSKSKWYEHNLDALLRRVTKDEKEQEHLIDLLMDLAGTEAKYDRDRRRADLAKAKAASKRR